MLAVLPRRALPFAMQWKAEEERAMGLLNDLLKELHRKHDPDTSKEAAASIISKRTLLQEDVLNYAFDQGDSGFTDEQLSKAFNCSGSTYRTRRAELTARGLIVPTQRRARLASGRSAVVWVHKDYQ
jgi:hypothetical protein